MGQHSPKMGQHNPKIGQHSPKMGQHGPKIGRRPSKYPAFYCVFLLLFRSFRLNMGHSRSANLGPKTGQHSPKVGQHSPKMDQHSLKMGQPRWGNIAAQLGEPSPRQSKYPAFYRVFCIASRWGNIALRFCSQLDPYHLNMGPWPAVARKRLNRASRPYRSATPPAR